MPPVDDLQLASDFWVMTAQRFTSKRVAGGGSQMVSEGKIVDATWEFFDKRELKNHLFETTTWEFVPCGAHFKIDVNSVDCYRERDAYDSLRH